MPRRTRLILPLAAGLATAALGLGAGPAQASRSTVRVGIADASAATFDQPQFQRLHIKRTRYIIKWNAIDDPAALAAADDFMQAAQRHHVHVLLHFATDDYRPRAAHLPSVGQYREKVGALVARYYPMGVREFGVFNEENDRTEPTYRSPSRAASYFVELWRMLAHANRCGRSVTARCRVVALDLLDGRTRANQANTRAYIKRFYRSLSPTYRRRGRIIGLHNYTDTNRHRTSGTRNALDYARHYVHDPVFWLTETGGIVKRANGSSVRFPTGAARAAKVTRFIFDKLVKLSPRIQRVYLYHWDTGAAVAGTPATWDSGFVGPDGQARPALAVLQGELRRLAR